MTEKILIVDDDEDLSVLLAAGMRRAGYEVVCAGDGQQGLELARVFIPDLVITDLQMPRMHGFEFCTAMRLEGQLAGAKIVVLTGKRYTADQRAAQMVGADAFMNKPYVLEELLGVVRGLLGAKGPVLVEA